MLPDLAGVRAFAQTMLKRLPALLSGIEWRRVVNNCTSRFSHAGPRSLANRILMLQFIWVIVIYVLVIMALWFATNLVIVNSIRHQGEGWISKLDEMGIPIYATNDSLQQEEAFNYLRNYPEIIRARYLDNTGAVVIAEYVREEGATGEYAPLTNDAVQSLRTPVVDRKNILFEKGSNSQMRISAPIWVKSIANDGMIDYSLDNNSGEEIETIGFIDIVLDYSNISNELNRNIIYASLLIALLMLVAAFIARTMLRWALSPLSNLEDPLTRLANGETDVTVNTTGDIEIARIGIALNTTICALKERDEVLRRMANHDALTGLANRKFFVERLEHEIRRIDRDQGSCALFFIDLDHFKYINDTYGHAAGDRLLVEIAKQLSRRIRGSDFLARFGGDEFTLLAYNVSRENAREIAESLIDQMRGYTFHEAGDIVKIYFSIGVTIIDDGSFSVHDYLKEADAAVHQAKAHGRNGFHIHSHETTSHADGNGTGWRKRLQETLQNRQAILHYQPIAGLNGQHEYIHEVLLRIPGMKDQIALPGEFMPAAERFGMMPEFDCQTIQMAAQLLEELKNPRIVVSVNISDQFFEKENIAEYIDGIIKDHHIKPKQFIFELTERQVVHNIEKYQLILLDLVRRGYRFAIDDFGAGFVLFNYIKKLPVHFLKIDSALIEGITEDSIARVSVRAIVEVAQELGIQTIAKNVLNEASVTILQEIGVDYAQGNYIAAPAPDLKLPPKKRASAA